LDGHIGHMNKKYKFVDENFYYECFDGWIPLLESLFYTIDKHLQHQEQIRKPVDFNITQIKEKFGCLRVYYGGGDDYIYGSIRMTENFSSKICERCGNKGEVRKGSWIKVLCDECQEKKDNSW
jgi:hypothetical protein